jgi:tRNA uridine 5-carboxymethylaminomethyl modification enzyme
MQTSPHGWRKSAPPEGAPLPRLGREALEIEIKYSNYLQRQEREVSRLQENSMAAIPRGTDFRIIPCLSKEEIEKLTAVQPATLAAAGAIAGVTPKALFYVYQHLKRGASRADNLARSSRGAPEDGGARQAVGVAVAEATEEDMGVPEVLMHHFPMTDDA